MLFILITRLPDIVLILQGEIPSWSLVGGLCLLLYLCLVSCTHFLEERGRGVSGFLVKFCLVSAVGLSEPLTHRLLSILWPIMDLISVTFWHM